MKKIKKQDNPFFSFFFLFFYSQYPNPPTGCTRQTSDRQTSGRRQTSHVRQHHRLMPPPGWALKILPNASKTARAGQRVDTSFSPHYIFVLRKVDEHVDSAKFGRLCSAFSHLGFWCPVGVGGCHWVGPALGCRPCWSLGLCTG